MSDEIAERVAVAIMQQMRRDIGRSTDWDSIPETHKEAFRRAALAALAAAAMPPNNRP